MGSPNENLVKNTDLSSVANATTKSLRRTLSTLSDFFWKNFCWGLFNGLLDKVVKHFQKSSCYGYTFVGKNKWKTCIPVYVRCAQIKKKRDKFIIDEKFANGNLLCVRLASQSFKAPKFRFILNEDKNASRYNVESWSYKVVIGF